MSVWAWSDCVQSRLGKTWVDVKCPAGYIHFVSNEEHLQEPHASIVIHLARRPLTAELRKEQQVKGRLVAEQR